MGRAITVQNLLDKKFDTFEFEGIWRKVIGLPEKVGLWIIYGAEKNGKTWFALKLAEYLSKFTKVLYISAEEGTDKTFVDAVRRAKLDFQNNNLQFYEYTPLDELSAKLSKQRSAKVVFFDNVTIYADDLKYGALKKFMKKHPNKLFIFLAHEEKNEPYTAQAKLIKKLAKIIVRVQGLACFVSGRCPGGTLTIDEEKAALFHGHEAIKND